MNAGQLTTRHTGFGHPLAAALLAGAVVVGIGVGVGVVATTAPRDAARTTEIAVPPAPPITRARPQAFTIHARPGEYVLAPGNLRAIGIAVPLPERVTIHARPGEYVLAPGNLQAIGIVVPLPRAVTSVPVADDFRLGPGNLEPPGVVDPIAG